MISLFILPLLSGCLFFEGGYYNFNDARISPYITDIRELPGTGFTAVSVEGIVYVLGVLEGDVVLFRAEEGTWSWSTYPVPATVFDLDIEWDGKDYQGSYFVHAARNAAGNDVLSLEYRSDTLVFNGSDVQSGTNQDGLFFSYSGTDYIATPSGTGEVAVKDAVTLVEIAVLAPAAGYTFGQVSNFSDCDGTSLYLVSWPEEDSAFSVHYADLRILKLPLASMGTWTSLTYPYGGEAISLDSSLGMKRIERFSLGMTRVWLRSYQSSYFFSPAGELLNDASTAGVPQEAAISRATGKLYDVKEDRLYEYTIP